MRALCFDAFGAQPYVTTIPDPTPRPDSVILQVGASGLCRSDWWGWKGYDTDIVVPHVPGHEYAGRIVAMGKDVRRFRLGDRATAPFVNACGRCETCNGGNQQVCPNQEQAGFSYFGSFAEYVEVRAADTNLVAVPDDVSDATAASLGCRFATAFRGVVDQARTKPGEWVAVHGCGGVGLSAIMIAQALGANVIAVDVADDKLAQARAMGAVATINSKANPDVIGAVRDLTGGGAHVSIDALGHHATLFNSISNLRRRGRHVQIGLMHSADQSAVVPMGLMISRELEVYGSHGMQAWRYEAMLAMIKAGKIAPQKMIGAEITLEEAGIELPLMDDLTRGAGIRVITRF
jgi:alcohol dehydrogenase